MVRSSKLREAIHVGRTNAKGDAFLPDKEEATDLVLFAVAEYVRDNYDGGLDMTFPNANMKLTFTVEPIDKDPDE